MWTNDVHADGVATALTELFAAEGLSAPSMRAIARQTHGAASSLVSRLGVDDARTLVVSDARKVNGVWAA